MYDCTEQDVIKGPNEYPKSFIQGKKKEGKAY